MTIASEVLAKTFHETYERIAPEFGYKTREESAKPWEEVPEQNKNLMIAVCAVVLAKYAVYQEALERLARLGNGDRLGNSDGNRIAQRALEYTPDQWNTLTDAKTAASGGKSVVHMASIDGNGHVEQSVMMVDIEPPKKPKQSPETAKAEIAYWDFDARHKGYGQYKFRPQSERDAFKAVFRAALLDNTAADPENNG